jgi:hypothetical protein
MDDFTDQILADGGAWSEVEVLGDRAIVKVRANLETLLAIAGTAGFRRLPKDRLDDSLSSLSSGVKLALRNELIDAGYSLAEIQERLGADLGSKTLRDVLRFAASRRRKPRYDQATDTIVCDGPEQGCRDIADVEREVSD